MVSSLKTSIYYYFLLCWKFRNFLNPIMNMALSYLISIVFILTGQTDPGILSFWMLPWRWRMVDLRYGQITQLWCLTSLNWPCELTWVWLENLFTFNNKRCEHNWIVFLLGYTLWSWCIFQCYETHLTWSCPKIEKGLFNATWNRFTVHDTRVAFNIMGIAAQKVPLWLDIDLVHDVYFCS